MQTGWHDRICRKTALSCERQDVVQPDKYHDRQVLFLHQVCVDKTESSNSPVLWRTGCYCRLTILMTDKSHDRQVSWQTSLMTDKSCFLVKSVLTRLKGVNSPVLGKAGCYCRQTSLMTDKSFLFGQVWVDHSERVNSPVSWQKGCFCRQSLVSWLVTVEPLLFREIRIYSGLSWHVSI